MSTAPANKEGRFTYSDYLTWPEDERWELIGGETWAMSPGPGRIHQKIALNLATVFNQFLRGKPCAVYIAPFDVVLSEEDVVQPDILVVCDRSKIKDTHVAGSPDLVVEVLSPSTSAKDRREKFDLYQKHGVREYVIVHPEERYVEQFLIGEDGKYRSPVILSAEDTYRPSVLEGLEINLKEVFS